MKFKLLFLLMSVMLSAKAVEVRIKLFSTQTFTSVTVTPDTGAYYLIALDARLRPIDTILDIFQEEKSRRLSIVKNGREVKPTKGEKSLGSYHAILIRSKNPKKQFRIEAEKKLRVYHGDLQIRVYDGFLQVINVVDLEDYVGGVVESEGGHLLNPEYFKAQAVLARTFVLKNWNKHMNEGYNLKDDVTSQVYFSKARYQFSDAIREAVECTKDTILVTYTCDPILGVFHANSGGCTVAAQDAWLNSVSYLQPKIDSFSLNVGSYNWERKVPKKEFYQYIASSLGVANDLQLHKAILNFDQKNNREAYFVYKGKKLKLTKIRFKFNLRSTYFKVSDAGDYLLIKGNGYGHGVGLSQDGAMEMDRRGYNYRQILEFYFDDVELESIEMLDL